MSIDEAFVFVMGVLNKNQNGAISPDLFNSFAPIAQLSVINQLIGNEQEYRPGMPVPRYGIGISQKIGEDLRPLMTSAALVFSSGVATYPVDSLYLFDLGLQSDNTLVKFVEVDEWRILNKSVIKPPTAQAPIVYVLGNSINIAPNTIANTRVSYVRKPATPRWGFNVVNAVPVYDASTSQDFEIGPMLQLRVCQRILQFAGMNLGLDEVVKIAGAMEAQGQ